jgi:ankyrin repeat protein
LGNTPLHISNECGNKSIIKILNNYGINNFIRNNVHKLTTKIKARKIMNDKKKSNNAKTIKSNKSEFKLFRYNIKTPKRKNSSDIINNNNQKNKRMMLSKYCKNYKSNPHFFINNKALNEMNISDVLNTILILFFYYEHILKFVDKKFRQFFADKN